MFFSSWTGHILLDIIGNKMYEDGGFIQIGFGEHDNLFNCLSDWIRSKRTIQNNECTTTTTCYFVQIGGQYNYAKYHNLIKFIAY